MEIKRSTKKIKKMVEVEEETEVFSLEGLTREEGQLLRLIFGGATGTELRNIAEGSYFYSLMPGLHRSAEACEALRHNIMGATEHLFTKEDKQGLKGKQ